MTEARLFHIDRLALLADLYVAYKAARQAKRGRSYQLAFEFSLEDNLASLADELAAGTYTPKPSTCFIIHDPKMREVFAADFRDRIVHHLLYNYTHVLFERTFIHDSYSCITGRGTHYGIARLKHHLRSVSQSYTQPCYVLKIDIRGYFMSIDRGVLLRLCRESLRRMRSHPSDVEGLTWGQKLNYPFVDFLLQKAINFNPTTDCRPLGSPSDWRLLPREKSLFWAAEGCGLPIGNLSSQLFSNVYLGQLDQFVKRTLRCKHYGRYVDDAYIVASSRQQLKSLINPLGTFLKEALGLTLHPAKTQIVDAYQGVEFLGAFVKPHRVYVSASSLRRMQRKLRSLPVHNAKKLRSSVNSYLGVLSHYRSYCLRKVMFGQHTALTSRGAFTADVLRYVPYALT